MKRRIPLDTDGDTLPDVFENSQANLDPNSPDADGDGTPDGQEDDDPDRPVVADAGPESHPAARSALGLVGDGLVAFEEYRGFFMLGTHTRTTTSTKDVFAGLHDFPPPLDPMPGGIGIGFLVNLSGFAVHQIEVNSTTAPEWDAPGTRVINANRTGIPGASDQRAIRIIVNNSLNNLGLAVEIPGNPFNQSPNEMARVEVNVSLHVPRMMGFGAGPDGIFCTADDAPVALASTQADDALRQSVGHECGHDVHIEHTFCFGDRQVIRFGQGLPNTTTVNSGPNGICDSAAVADDVQVVPTGQGAPNSVIITAGPNSVLDSGSALAGDDAVVGTTVVAGPDGIAQTTAVPDDVQVIPVGEGQPNAPCVDTGADGVSNTTKAGDDVQTIAVGNGLADQMCIDDSGDGTLLTNPGGDDATVGLTITTGPNGICQTRAIARIIGSPSVMTSDVLVPIPSSYTSDNLDQVRIHQKHP